ncbi:MAG: hypothetical protein R3C12_06525 [Planctomycetaceae bacterium]
MTYISEWTSAALAEREESAPSKTDGATKDASPERQAWSLFCQSLFASNEFIFVK